MPGDALKIGLMMWFNLILKLHFVSRHILINFITTQWPDVYFKLQNVYQ